LVLGADNNQRKGVSRLCWPQFFKMTQKVAKDTPLAEVTLRRYEKPYKLSKRELVKKLCLSLGLLQPGDSRDVIVDVFLSLLNVRKEKKELSSKQIEQAVIKIRKENNLESKGTASSNIRRQIKRLRDIFLVEKVKSKYRINEFGNLNEIFSERIEQFYIKNIFSRIGDYLQKADEVF